MKFCQSPRQRYDHEKNTLMIAFPGNSESVDCYYREDKILSQSRDLNNVRSLQKSQEPFKLINTKTADNI